MFHYKASRACNLFYAQLELRRVNIFGAMRRREFKMESLLDGPSLFRFPFSFARIRGVDPGSGSGPRTSDESVADRC